MSSDYSVIDDVNVPEMEDGFTYARTEDGGSSWEIVEGGTKGRSNGGTPDERPEDPDDGNNPDDDQPSGVDYSALKLNELNGNDKFIELYNSCGRRRPMPLRRIPVWLRYSSSACPPTSR